MSDTSAQRPTNNDDREGWTAFWAVQGMPWRTEPEIGEERQRYLAERRAITPDIVHGVYPFKDLRLYRADIEWLLATHESGDIRGPVDWDDSVHHKRQGIDLRGASLEGETLDGLPLAKVRGGLSGNDYDRASADQREAATIRLKGASLRYARLEGGIFTRAHMEGINLHFAHLEGAELYRAHLEGEGDMPADLTLAVMDSATRFSLVTLGNKERIGPRIEGIQWNGVRLGGIDWLAISKLGDELPVPSNVAVISDEPTEAFRALLAYRQLAVALREQGLNEYADRFAYRAQLLQRRLLLRRGQLGRALGSWLLDFISGYGYKPLRSLIAYVVIICLFAGAYLLNAQFAAPHLTWDESLVLSISSFHGRGFFTSGVSLGDTLARLAAGEAIVGLLIEITFIATFTQRFFAR
jgi:hypothetical protein